MSRPRLAVYVRLAAEPGSARGLDVRADGAAYAERHGWTIEPVAQDVSASRPGGAR